MAAVRTRCLACGKAVTEELCEHCFGCEECCECDDE